MPDNLTQINRDVRSDIQASVGSLGTVKAGEVAVKTEIVAKNLFDKYPNVDKVVTIQMMAATYCPMIRDSQLSETAKQQRWECFQDKVFTFLDSTFPKHDEQSAQETLPSKQHSPGFSVASCGSIKDNKTGLEWFVGPDRNTTWLEANSWVRKLSACGGDWRLPNIRELKTLYNQKLTAGTGHYERGQHWPAHIPPEFKEIVGGSWVWSKQSASSNDARSFNFNQGLAVVYPKDNTTYSTRAFAVR